jgi:hypothetical protein
MPGASLAALLGGSFHRSPHRDDDAASRDGRCANLCRRELDVEAKFSL